MHRAALQRVQNRMTGTVLWAFLAGGGAKWYIPPLLFFWVIESFVPNLFYMNIFLKYRIYISCLLKLNTFRVFFFLMSQSVVMVNLSHLIELK